MELTASNEAWCIEDSLFYPLGLINHTAGNKTVFVTWSSEYLMNFIFKKITESSSYSNKFIINVPQEILDIIILEVNTLVLLQNGEVCYFSSIKSIHRIPWLNTGVRCVSQSIDGFSLIRVHENNRINLEIYNDVPNVGKNPQECFKSFDLTFDEKNIFNSDWTDEKFNIASIKITDINKMFLKLLVKDMELNALEVHVFSFSNNLFALYLKEDDFEIKTLAPQISTVELIKYLEDQNMLLIFLNCGTIEVWYMSGIANVIEKYTYINGSELIHHTFVGNILYFTDEQKVSQLKFTYDAVEHTCQVTEQSVDAPGMVAVTYVEATKNLVCLSNNNIFYNIKFENIDHEDLHKDNLSMYELTDEKVSEFKSKSNLFHELHSLPAKMDKYIEEEYKKQELIAVCRKNSIYSELIAAEVSFCQHIPEVPERFIYPTDEGIPPFTYFAVLTVKILSNEIFKSTVWNLMISFSSQVKLLSITPELLQEKFSILIPIKQNCNEIFPEIDVQMLAHVRLEQDFVCINIPVKLQGIDVRKMFSKNRGLNQLPIEPDVNTTLLSWKITCPKLNAVHVLKAFGLAISEGSENLDDDVLIETLYFLGKKLSIYFNDPLKALTVQSNDPIVMYYSKICVSKFIWENIEQSTDEYEELRKVLLELQCQIEKKYGSLSEKELHLSNLKRIYNKLRKEVEWKF